MGTITKKIQRIIILQIILLPFFIYGQVDSLSAAKRPLPVLNNHYFTPTSSFPSAFMTTFFKTGIGGGLSLTQIPISLNNGETLLGTLEGENTYITADIHVQVKAKDWLSVWFRYQANARIGSSKPTILAHGVTSITGFEFGWMFRLLHTKKSQLSGTIHVINSTISSIHLLNFIKDVIHNPDSSNVSLTKMRNPLYGGAGFRYAYSFSDIFGIQAYLNTSYGESILRNNETVWKFSSGVLGSFNFIHSYGIPIGINLGYSIQKLALFDNKEEDNSKSFILKIAYTGREEYSIGLEFLHVNAITPLIKNTASLAYLTTSFVMVYYF